MCTYSAGCLVISPSSGHGGAAANNIPYGIALLDVQRRRVPALSPEKQPPQIRHLAADNRKQFRVRVQGLGKGLRAWRGSSSARLDLPGDFLPPLGLGAQVLESIPHRHNFDSLHLR